jgi:signal transduction histidine kinase
MGTSAQVAQPRTKDRGKLDELAEQQAALRRVATLMAGGASSTEVFAAAAEEVAQALHLANAAVCRYDDEVATMTVLAVWGDRPDTFQPGSRWPLDGPSMSAVLRAGRPARVEDDTGLPGSLAAEARKHGFNRVVAAPIIVDGRIWGVISTSSPDDAPRIDHLEDRLAEFTELVATAIANTQARDELTRLAEEQTALRRVATLVAEGATPAEVFEAVSVEVAQLVPADGAAVTRFERDGTVTALGGWTTDGDYAYVGTRYPLEGTVSGRVFEARGPARVDNYADAPGSAPEAARDMGWRSSVGAPITVEGRLWGVLAVVSKSERPLPLDTERRLAKFTELVATAIANAESREELRARSEEQAALRRVATLVARGVPAPEILDAVAAEVNRLLGSEWAAVHRFEPDGVATIVSSCGALAQEMPVGSRAMLDSESVVASVMRTGRSARLETHEGVAGPWAERARALGVRSAIGAPITVEGRLWGVMVAVWREEGHVPVIDAEARMADFTELVGTAIANAESRAALDASRARIVTTADATRRRIERDLHDGAQQQLVTLALELRAAQKTAPPKLREHQGELSHIAEGLANVLDGLREIALGIHPAILAEGGLGPALKTLAHRSPIPVELDVRVEGRLPEPVEVAAYYVVSEALTNAAKYAQASVVRVSVEIRDGVLHVAVNDDGVGGADPNSGSGLLGLKDRAEAIGGTMSLLSREGAGTSLRLELPLGKHIP